MRFPVALAPYLLAAAFIGGGYIWYLGDLTAGLAPIISEGVTIGGPFALTDQNGVIRRDSEFRGKYMLVFFGFTSCPDVCPTTLAVLKAALENVGAKADRIVPIFISVDPERDTPEVMKPYLDAFSSPKSRFVGLTGSLADVTAAVRAYHVYFRKRPQPDGPYSVDHSSVIYLMGPDGKYLTHYLPEQGPDAIAADLLRRT